MDALKLLKGLRITKQNLNLLRQLIGDTLLNYIKLRMIIPGVIMKTESDNSFKITIDGLGNWSVAAGYIINNDGEIIINPINGLIPKQGSEPGNLAGNDNPLDPNNETEQYIIVQTKEKTQEVDYGSMSVVASSNAVVGIDTKFTKWFEAGNKFKIANSIWGNNGEYIVESVIDDTHLTTVSNFNATESGLKFSLLGEYFSGYPVGGNKNLLTLNSFSFRVEYGSFTLNEGEYLLAKCIYDGSWHCSDMRSYNRFAIPQIRNEEILDFAITLNKMAANSVDENKIVSTALGAGLTGGSGSKIQARLERLIDTNGQNAGTLASDQAPELIVWTGETLPKIKRRCIYRRLTNDRYLVLFANVKVDSDQGEIKLYGNGQSHGVIFTNTTYMEKICQLDVEEWPEYLFEIQIILSSDVSTAYLKEYQLIATNMSYL